MGGCSNFLVWPMQMRSHNVEFWKGCEHAAESIGRGLCRLIDQTDVSGNDPPAFCESDPGLHLPSNFSRCSSSAIQCRCHGMVAPITGDDDSRKSTRQAERRTCSAEGCNLCISIEVFVEAIADRACIVTEDFI